MFHNHIAQLAILESVTIRENLSPGPEFKLRSSALRAGVLTKLHDLEKSLGQTRYFLLVGPR